MLSYSSPLIPRTGNVGQPVNVLRALRTQTANSHHRVEASLNFTDAAMTLAQLQSGVGVLATFWTDAERGLDAWAEAFPQHARALEWSRRRRAATFEDDVRSLGGVRAAARIGPHLPPVTGVAQALGRLYVLEGSSLGGQLINAAFAGREAGDPLAGVRLRGLDPYGEANSSMWQSFRRYLMDWVDAGGDAAAVVEAGVVTFEALEAFSRPSGYSV